MRKTLAIAASGFLLLSAAARAADVPSTTVARSARTDVAVTVYNEDLALVRDTREFDVASGESVVQFEAGGRADLVARETAEIALLQTYLPAQLSDAEIDQLIAEAIAASGATSIKDMGKAMAVIKSKAQGKADMAKVGARVKAKLSG